MKKSRPNTEEALTFSAKNCYVNRIFCKILWKRFFFAWALSWWVPPKNRVVSIKCPFLSCWTSLRCCRRGWMKLLLLPTSEVALASGCCVEAWKDATRTVESLNRFRAEEFPDPEQHTHTQAAFIPPLMHLPRPLRKHSALAWCPWPPHLHHLRARWVASVSTSGGCGGFLTHTMTYNSEASKKTSEAAFRLLRAAGRRLWSGARPVTAKVSPKWL